MLVTLIPVLAAQVVAASVLGAPVEGAVEREAWVMGTRLRIVAESSSDAAALEAAERVIAEVERLDELLSTWRPDSEMARVNRGLPGKRVSVSLELHGLLSEAFAWADTTGNAFHPGLGPYVDAWDLRGTGRVPEPSQLRVAEEASRLHVWRLEDPDSRVARAHPSAWIDTGAFGKGAALRSAARLLGDEEGRLLADLGGQVLARAPRERPWPVGVAHPVERGRPVAWLSLHGGVSAATSGTSERFVEVDGVRYGHIVDARAGWPAPAWGTVTVVHPDPMVADVLATALYVMGPDDGFRWLQDRPGIAALFLDVRRGTLRARWTPTMESWLEDEPSNP